jgi:hypothetical protein
MDLEDQPIVIQEAVRMNSPGAGESEELVKEDTQRVLGASLPEISAAAAIMCHSFGINPKSLLGEAMMRTVRTSMICGARTAQRLNGNDVL